MQTVSINSEFFKLYIRPDENIRLLKGGFLCLYVKRNVKIVHLHFFNSSNRFQQPQPILYQQKTFLN